MRKRDEVRMKTSCWNKAGSDDQVFVLLGSDAAAPAAVRAWVRERIRACLNEPGDPKLVEALEWAELVERQLEAEQQAETERDGPQDSRETSQDR